MGALWNIYIQVRIFLDHVIDFFFSLYWDKRKKPIPNLEKKHSFLAESALSLANKIKRRELKSEELVRAVVERILQVNPIINAIAKDRYEAAISEARKVDELIAAGLSQEEADSKPYLGVPFTAKESQAMKDMPYTMGLWARRNEVSKTDSAAVVLLREAGAIPVAVTNLPELLIWQETRNPVYGLSRNPQHTGRSPGGSSGAEAALTAVYATPISLCSDIGGSTRMPAFYCGMFGHHPTPGSNSIIGTLFREKDADSMASLGFIAKNVEDLGPLCKTIAKYKSKFNIERDINIKDIKIYFMETAYDPHVSSVRPELRSAMIRVVSKLTVQATSSDMVPQPYYHEGFNNMYRLWSYWLRREPEVYEEMFTNYNGEANLFVELVKWMFGRTKHCFFTFMNLIDRKLPLMDSQEAVKLTEDMRADLLSKLGDNGVLLLPSGPQPAPYHYSCYLRPYNFAYFGIVNVLKYPATQVPLGRTSEGLPLGIQVVGTPYNDAVCLAVAKYLEKEFGGAVMACNIKN